MPDLNLVDEGGLEESPTPITPAKSGGGGGGGAMRTILIFLIVVVIVGAGGFFLYKKGIFPFKKKPAPVQIEDEPLAAEPEPTINPSDTAAVSLLETTPVEESMAMKKAPETKAAGSTAEMMTASAKLTDMKGDYTVQVVAFREKSKADDIVRNLDDAGYPAFVERIPMKGADWFTVRVGRYPSAKDARKAVESFGEQLKSSYFVDRVRSK